MPSRPLNKGIFAVAALITFGFLLYFGAFFVYPPAAAALLIIAGRGPDCGRWEAIKGYYRNYRSRFIEAGPTGSGRILTRDSAGYQLVETSMGRFWEPAIQGGSSALAQVIELESKYAGVRGLRPRPGEVVLDCGANVGVFTRAALASGARTVIAIEPAPNNVACLKRNFIDEIAAGRVLVVEKGVWDKQGVLPLGRHDDTPARDSFVMHEHRQLGPVVPLTTIDKLVADLSLERVNFIKMDIEGAEQRALAGAALTLARHHPRLEISVNHLPEDPVRVPAIIKRAWPGYTVQCLRCELNPHHRVAAEILFFQ